MANALFEDVTALLQQAEYFIDALSDYKCDVALFPEFFNAPLMGIKPAEPVSSCLPTHWI
jgi:predicted amidohydrolase